MPNPRKPMAIKQIQGTADRNKQRQNPNEPTPTRGIGPAPEHLGEQLGQVWDEVVSQMYAGVLGEADRIALETMVRLINLMRTDFDTMTAAQLARLNGLLSQFGMTPADRTKISVPKNKDQGNPFEGM